MPIAVAGCAALAAIALSNDESPVKISPKAFYPMAFTGAALGTVAMMLGAPDVIHSYWKLPLTAAGCAALAVCALWDGKSDAPARVGMRFALLAVTAGFAAYLARQQVQTDHYYALSERNFYGVLHVRDDPPDAYIIRASAY